MAYTKKLTRVGNSTGMTFDRAILRQVGWETDQEVEISVKGNSLLLRPYRFASKEDVAASAARMSVRHKSSLEKLSR